MLSLPKSVAFFKNDPLLILLIAFPIAYLLKFMGAPALAIFVISGIAIVPLAGLMGRATEHLAEKLGAGIGGLLNATFGNAAELIIALIALSKGPQMYDLVQASITGSIIGNVLLVLGLSILAGGMYHRRLVFNATASGLGATLLALAAAGLILPSLYYFSYRFDQAIGGKYDNTTVEYLSEEISVVLIVTYILSLIFSLKTHRHLFAGEGHDESSPEETAHGAAQATPDAQAGDEHAGHAPWSRKKSITVLLVATVAVALMSEVLIGSVEEACHALGMTQVFVGVIVVAIVGNAAEHSTAVLVAMKNKMDLAVTIAVGSSIQIALFVAPVLVFASLLMGHEHPLDLHFTPMELVAVVMSVAVLALVCLDGESHWMEGVMLLAFYVILALAFFHLPGEGGAAVEADGHTSTLTVPCQYLGMALLS